MNKKKRIGMNWPTTEYNDGVNVQQLGASGFSFVFPDSSGHINSVVANRKGVLPRPVKTITIRYRISAISGNPTFQFVDHSGGGGLLPNFRPRIATSFLADRCWPSGVNCAFIELSDDEQVYTVRCAPGLWQDVNGGSNPKGFTSTLKKTAFGLFPLVAVTTLNMESFAPAVLQSSSCCSSTSRKQLDEKAQGYTFDPSKR